MTTKWKLESKPKGIFPHRIIAEDGAEVCRLHSMNQQHAKLIASAPAMYEALQIALENEPQNTERYGIYKRALAQAS